MSRGYVYILSNSAMPGLVKIGMTTGDPASRAAQLYTTGVPGPFEVIESFWSPDCDEMEAHLHSVFATNRVHQSREFFRVESELVVSEAEIHLEKQVNGLVTDYLPDFRAVPAWKVYPEQRLEQLTQHTGWHEAEVVAALTLLSNEEVADLRGRLDKRVSEFEAEEAQHNSKVVTFR